MSSYIYVQPGDILYVYVGGAGDPGLFKGKGGWNGGGNGGYHNYHSNSGGGGGATDLRIGGENLTNRVLVAAGGAGGSGCSKGGDGGGFIGVMGNPGSDCGCNGNTAPGLGFQSFRMYF